MNSIRTKPKLARTHYHVVFWVMVIFSLVLIFGRSWNNPQAAFYYIAMLLPVVMGTSYFFNYVLVPKYLLKKKYFWFGLYFVYTIIISLYLSVIIMMFAFVYLAKFNMGYLAPNARDILLIGVVMYLVVFAGSFLLMLQQLALNIKELTLLKSDINKQKSGYLEVMSNRKSTKIAYNQILYVESMADYVSIHTESRVIRSKEKISILEKKLPGNFVRIHRSFVVNKHKVSHYTNQSVDISGSTLTIGRSYKVNAVKILNADNQSGQN